MTDGPAVTAEAEARALAAPPAATRQRLIVIGNGMGGARAVEEILERGGAGLFDITMFGDEPHGNDNRISLSNVIAGSDGRRSRRSSRCPASTSRRWGSSRQSATTTRPSRSPSPGAASTRP
jgi:hypothetical protein